MRRRCSCVTRGSRGSPALLGRGRHFRVTGGGPQATLGHLSSNSGQYGGLGMRNARITAYEDTPRDVVATGNDYSPHTVLPSHAHRRGQLLYASTGVLTVLTAEGG